MKQYRTLLDFARANDGDSEVIKIMVDAEKRAKKDLEVFFKNLPFSTGKPKEKPLWQKWNPLI